MANVLISFLGTSVGGDRTYKTADYQMQESKSGWHRESTFIASVLKVYFHIDRMILVGTVNSMWENVYKTFAEEQGCYDENVYREIKEVCCAEPGEAELPHIDKIEQVLGQGSKVVLVKYGKNQEEIQYNNETILGLERLLHKGDELFIDITHSFRSLPLMLMNTMVYIKTVSSKNIRIKHISYGMFEATKDGLTPVVELNSLLDTMDWITGAYSFMNYGDAYQISEKLKTDYRQLAQQLQDFSDVKNMGLMQAFEDQVEALRHLSNDMPKMASIVVPDVVQHFLDFFNGTKGKPAKFQFRLACWYAEKHNYSAAYLTAVEAIVSYVTQKEGGDVDNVDDRDSSKEAILNKHEYGKVKRIYVRMNPIRKEIAHSKFGNNDYRSKINDLTNDFLPRLERIIMSDR
jgi:CRISPR-associated Csx2 family protein